MNYYREEGFFFPSYIIMGLTIFSFLSSVESYEAKAIAKGK